MQCDVMHCHVPRVQDEVDALSFEHLLELSNIDAT